MAATKRGLCGAGRAGLGRHRSRPGRALPVLALALALVLSTAWLAWAPPSAAAGRDDAGDEGLPSSGLPAASSQAGAYLAGIFAAAADDQAAAADFLVQALALDGDNEILYRRAFIATLSGGLIEESVRLAPGIIPRGGGEADVARLVLAADDFVHGRYGEAATALRTIGRNGIARFTAPMLEAWALAGTGALDDALAALDPVAAEDGFLPLVDLHRALIRDVAGDPGAAEAYEAALAHGESPRLVAAAGNFFERNGAPDRARRLYGGFIADTPDSLQFAPALARLDAGEIPPPLLTGVGHGAAEVLFQIASVISRETAGQTGLVYVNLARYLRPGFAAAGILLGDILADRDHDRQALAIYRGVADDPGLGWDARLRSARMLARLELDTDAIALLEAMAAERPDRAEPLVQLGDVHRFTGDFAAAVVAYDAAFEADSLTVGLDWSFLYRRGMALERDRDFDRAIADLERAISLNEDHAHLLNYLGYLWIDLGRNMAEGEALVRRALELRPNDGYIIDSLGWAQYRQGLFDEAVETLERAVRFRPLDPVINDHLGDAYWQVGRRTEARFQWSHALVGADDPVLIEAIEAKLAHGLNAAGDGPATTADASDPNRSPGTAEPDAIERP